MSFDYDMIEYKRNQLIEYAKSKPDILLISYICPVEEQIIFYIRNEKYEQKILFTNLSEFLSMDNKEILSEIYNNFQKYIKEKEER